MKKDKKVMNDKGFSLVELIVTVLVTSLLLLGVLTFVSSSRTAYQTVSTSATLQEEAMTVERVLTEKIQEAKEHGFDDNVNLGSGKLVDVFWITTRDEENISTDSVYFFVHDKADNKLRYCKGSNPADLVEKASTDSVTSNAVTLINNQCYGAKLKFSLIADHVVSMEEAPTVERADGTDLVLLKFKYEYMDKSYTNTVTTVTRNKNRALSAPDPEEDTEEG